MAELSLKQITDKLNTAFTGETRMLVFWYDANAEFVEDVDSLALDNAKVYHLEKDNQFYTKYFLECVDTTTNYLVYAPFAKPDTRENHLADTIRYSREFFADRASLLMLDLGIDAQYKPVIQEHIRFFDNKRQMQAFYNLELDRYNKTTIEVAMMAVLCKCKAASLEEVLRVVIMDGGIEEDNTYLKAFEKYGLLNAFWELASDHFGISNDNPTLEKLTLAIFVTYADKTITAELPAAWEPYIRPKSGNSIAFLDNLMNNYLYSERFDELSAQIYSTLNGKDELTKLPLEALTGCNLFAGIDELFITWATARLEMEDVGAKLNGATIPQLLKNRRQGHFGRQRMNEYLALENAWYLISGIPYQPSASLDALVKNYTSSLYQMDRWYRYFYYYLDQFEDSEQFTKLKELVENIYANEYLAKVCANWAEHFYAEAATLRIPKQPSFYSNNVQCSKEQLVVIISDALRYEVGVSLFEKLEADEKCTATLNVMTSTLPSITEYGMAALLPHLVIELTDDYSVLVDGQKADSLEQRQVILQKKKPQSRCVQYDDIKGLSVAELRSIFTRQEVVYVYHNQIDARGDKLSTENEVFIACAEAVEEISALIRRLTTSANRSRFIITADHGFMYRREKLDESDKISSGSNNGSAVARRYVLSDTPVNAEGVASIEIGVMMENADKRMVSCPIGADIFKAPGSGINYVHGGCSPQEMLIPLIDVKTEKAYKETKTARISLVSRMPKITNLRTFLDFVQAEPVSDVVKEATYRICFIADDGSKISNEHLYVANKTDAESVKRMFRLRFDFKNISYDNTRKYYLVAYDDKTNLEVLRSEVKMDIAFSGDYGFGF